MYLSLQGNIGLRKAIEYFTSHQISIAVPLNDTQSYDLIADFDGKLQRIQVKTSKFSTTNGKSYTVQLRNCGGNRTGKARVVKFDNTKCDYLFVYSGDDKCYLIPSCEIKNINAIKVGLKFKEYEVHSKLLSEFTKEQMVN